MSRKSPPATHVAKKIISAYGDRLHDKALCLTTPIPEMIPLSKVEMRKELLGFLKAYEPRITESGLYSHQAETISAFENDKTPNILMTTATGSGKSLAFWAWAFEIMLRDRNVTTIATFPTQALLWGQAKRLSKISEPQSLIQFKELDNVCFGGTIRLGGFEIPWSVWYGTTDCKYMKEHTKSEAFSKARLRLSTLDKVHWSMMRKEEDGFLSRLAGIVVDEAHSWHGLSGANVRSMFDRMRLSMDMLRCSKRPSFFLATATLSDATQFAKSLTGELASSFLEVNDQGSIKASLVPAKDVPALLDKPAKPGLLRRYALLMKPEPEQLKAKTILGDSNLLGQSANLLCFVQSKFVGHRLCFDLQRDLPGRDIVVYDGDLPPKHRRKIEDDLFKKDEKPKVIIGTSALELGVDLPTLDVVIMDDLPPRRCELLQRLGRVGRSSDRPGLAVLCLGYSPGDERLIEEPLATLAVENIRALQLPLHLDVVHLKAMYAASKEWPSWRRKKQSASWSDFKSAMERNFPEAPHIEVLNNKLDEALGDVLDISENNWYYKGFRVSASDGKRDLKLEINNEEYVPVATIDDIAIFRDAHPEAVYLGHRGVSYRIKKYVGKWEVGTWTSPKGVVLGKWMKGLKHIIVSVEKEKVATRGRWIDTFKLEETKKLPDGHDTPADGRVIFGVFNFIRKFDGYQEIDLLGRAKTRTVTLQEIAKRFSETVKSGEEFPFLHNFSYRTKGWKWSIVRVLDENTRKTLATILGPILQGFFCNAVECAMNDLQVMLDAQKGELRVVDSTPGGNGLSEAMLTEGRVSSAWDTAIKQIKAKSEEAFRRYMAEECRIESKVNSKEVINAIECMRRAWNG